MWVKINDNFSNGKNDIMIKINFIETNDFIDIMHAIMFVCINVSFKNSGKNNQKSSYSTNEL